MTDSNLTEKMSLSITKAFKKTDFFEKFERMRFYTYSFIVFSSIIGISGLVMHYLNTNAMIENFNNLNRAKKDISNDIDLKNDLLNKKLEEKINELENKILALLNEQTVMLNDVANLSIVEKKEVVSRATSVSSFISELAPKKNESMVSDEGWHLSEKDESLDNVNYVNDVNNDDEIMNECYDSIPLNNFKKVTGLKGWLF